jgi:hypothetical protein
MYQFFFLTYHTSITGFQGCNTLFSHGGTQNIASVISAMDHLDKHLASIATSPKYGRAIKAAVALGKRTLNKYYSTGQQKTTKIVRGGSRFFTGKWTPDSFSGRLKTSKNTLV